MFSGFSDLLVWVPTLAEGWSKYASPAVGLVLTFFLMVLLWEIFVPVGWLVGGPILFAFHEQAQIRNFHVVRKGVLYRSGQLSLAGLQRIIHDYGINTVITLRDAMRLGDPPPDLEEEKYCLEHEINSSLTQK